MTDEQTSLLEMAGQSLTAAEVLAAEGIHRFAVSRCYYAMFYCAEALLLSKALSFSKHSAVISAFGREFAKTGMLPAELHRVLIDARQLREQGDYDAEATIDRAVGSQQISRAQRFVDAATAYLSE